MHMNQVCIAAAALVASQAAVCRGAYARDAGGRSVGSRSANAVQWDVAGAIDHIVEHEPRPFLDAWRQVLRSLGVITAKDPNKEAIRRIDHMTKTKQVELLRAAGGLQPTNGLEDRLAQLSE